MKTKHIISIGVIAAVLGLFSVGIYYRYSGVSMRNYTGIVDYQKKRDKQAVLNIFNKYWYWLVSEYSKNFNPEFMLGNLSHYYPQESYGQVSIKVMLEEGRLVGFVVYYMKKFYEGFLWFLAVDEKVRNKKYGRLLMQTALDDLARKGARYVRLITRTNNYPAQVLYKRLGFVEINRDNEFVNFEYVVKTHSA